MARAKPAVYNIFIRKEADWDLDLLYKDSAGNPIDNTSWSAWLTIREKHEGDETIQLTEADGISLGGADGTIVCELTNAQTAALGISKGVWDLLLEDDSVPVVRFALLEGVVSVGRAVTRGV